MADRRLRLGGFALLAVAYAALAGGLFVLGSHTLFWIRAESAAGQVIGHQRIEETVRRRIGTIPADATVVAYRTAAGQDIVSVADWGSSIKVYAVGDDVTVLYMPNDPAEARIRGFLSLYAAPILLLILGSGFWIAGQMVTVFAERPSSKAGSRPER